jgi:urate oxidase
VTGGRWAAEQYGWSRINDHDHSFYRSAPETRTAVLVRDGADTTVISGFYGLTVMKTTQSGFAGYPKDKYTTLVRDRRPDPGYGHRHQVALQHQLRPSGDLDFNELYDSVKADNAR